MSWSVLLGLSLIFHDGLYRGVRSVGLGVILQAGFIKRLKLKKNNTDWVYLSICDFTHIYIDDYVHIYVHLSIWVCQQSLKCVLGETNLSDKFVYSGWADVKTQSALNRKTKHTHLAEIKQKLSWPPLSLHSPSTLCLSMPSPLK